MHYDVYCNPVEREELYLSCFRGGGVSLMRKQRVVCLSKHVVRTPDVFKTTMFKTVSFRSNKLIRSTHLNDVGHSFCLFVVCANAVI